MLTADKEIELRCGKASITLTKAGKILLRGEYLLSRSSGVNRIKGGSVDYELSAMASPQPCRHPGAHLEQWRSGLRIANSIAAAARCRCRPIFNTSGTIRA